MATSQNYPIVVFAELAKTSPSVSQLLQNYVAKLHTDLASGSAVNGYGNAVAFTAQAMVRLEPQVETWLQSRNRQA